jgi:putative proteasome-type protease
MDSTLKSNLSVGLPLDMAVYEADSLECDRVICIEDNNPYLQMVRRTWGEKLREVFDSIEHPSWNGGATNAPLMVPPQRSAPIKKITTDQDKLI